MESDDNDRVGHNIIINMKDCSAGLASKRHIDLQSSERHPIAGESKAEPGTCPAGQVL